MLSGNSEVEMDADFPEDWSGDSADKTNVPFSFYNLDIRLSLSSLTAR